MTRNSTGQRKVEEERILLRCCQTKASKGARYGGQRSTVWRSSAGARRISREERSGGEARTGAALEIWEELHGAGAGAGLAGELKRQDREAGMNIFRSGHTRRRDHHPAATARAPRQPTSTKLPGIVEKAESRGNGLNASSACKAGQRWAAQPASARAGRELARHM
ncbi:LOW QUALITY PROTEIN: hypothetical protein SORBI_3003G279600 [Sorghum bicolor]|uniref:Uncharacterized protein n=1 Tax=Sorghum bicolor TaxID=4558 RepID=A0A1B6Q5S3_SORBI|nr:LOW QUALITY PROTEIN: hypothetical protein SORBI_3003G279600 [Sorghum bicolor]